MKMEKKKFRIGHLADELGVERFVIRFWEKEFNVKPRRSDGGQRFYKKEDLEQFKRIKELLYNEGFTIAGAKKILNCPETQEPKISKDATIMASHKTTFVETTEYKEQFEKLCLELKTLKDTLEKLQKLL